MQKGSICYIRKGVNHSNYWNLINEGQKVIIIDIGSKFICRTLDDRYEFYCEDYELTEEPELKEVKHKLSLLFIIIFVAALFGITLSATYFQSKILLGIFIIITVYAAGKIRIKK